MALYQSTITNEQTAELPSARFDGHIIVVEREDQIENMCRDLSAQSIIGFDTETRPSFKAGVSNKVALLQLSTHQRCYLIRLCRTKLHNAILKILSNPNIIKIGADVAGDLRSLHALRHFHERGFIDLQHIASAWGIEEKSLRKMSAIVLGQRVSKAQRLSNWEASTLTPQQQMYAATDAWVCISIYEHLLKSEPLTEPKIEEVISEAGAVKRDATTHKRETTKAKREPHTTRVQATAKSEEHNPKRAEYRRRRHYRKPKDRTDKEQ
ncbi:MAG: 3'-5' exonuclease domain-containing protein 2 [Alistipes sp.]|nr:3'-5' exonuclease domain-containing protein 2 [Alistipes sp.]